MGIDPLDVSWSDRRAAWNRIAIERGRADAQGRKDALRDQRVNVIWRGLNEAIRTAPDLFPAIDTQRLAERVVDELIGG